MNTTDIFQKKMREAKFASLEEVRTVIKHDTLVPEYVLEVLFDRGVLTVNSDGSVQGLEEGAPTNTSKLKSPKKWGDAWPKRTALLEIMAGGAALKFVHIQDKLDAMGQPNGHWFVVHALRYLEKEGLVLRDGKKYVLKGGAPAPVVEDFDEEGEGTYKVLTRILKKVGAPYPVEAVKAAIKATPGLDITEDDMKLWDDPDCWQNQIIGNRRKEGILP